MYFIKMFKFRAPYLDADDGVNLGGGDVILPDNFTPAADTKPQNGTNGQSGTETQQETDYTPFLKSLSEKVKFNHAPVEIKSLDDVVTNFQKGLNYDNLQTKFDKIQNDPRLNKYEKVQQVSSLLGYQTEDDLVEALYNTYYQSLAEQQGLTPEQVKKDHEIKQRETALNQKEQTDKQKQSTNEMYDRFLTAYPEIKPTDIKPETWAKVNKGMDLTAAYVEQQNQDLRNKIKTLETNNANIKKAPVGGVTMHGGGEPAAEDVFMKGFNSI